MGLNALAEHNSDKRNVKTALEAYEKGDAVAPQESYNCITASRYKAIVLYELSKKGDLSLLRK